MTKKEQLEKLSNEIIHHLSKNGIACYLHVSAVTTNSCYIRLYDARLGSIRVSDHEGKEKYGYKFNVRSDFPKKYARWKLDDNIWRYYMGVGGWKTLVKVIKERQEHIKKHSDYWNTRKSTHIDR